MVPKLKMGPRLREGDEEKARTAPAQLSREGDGCQGVRAALRNDATCRYRSEHATPIARHAHDRDAIVAGLVERFSQRTDPKVAVVCELACGVIVMNE